MEEINKKIPLKFKVFSIANRKVYYVLLEDIPYKININLKHPPRCKNPITWLDIDERHGIRICIGRASTLNPFDAIKFNSVKELLNFIRFGNFE